jgi:hypothetical protein
MDWLISAIPADSSEKLSASDTCFETRRICPNNHIRKKNETANGEIQSVVGAPAGFVEYTHVAYAAARIIGIAACFTNLRTTARVWGMFIIDF